MKYDESVCKFNMDTGCVELPHCAVVSAAGVTARPDGLHFTTESLRTLGLRYLEAYKSLE